MAMVADAAVGTMTISAGIAVRPIVGLRGRIAVAISIAIAVAIVVRIVAEIVVLMLVVMLHCDVVISLRVRLIQLAMKSFMLVRGQTLLVGIIVDSLELLVDVLMLLIQLLVLFIMLVIPMVGVSDGRNGKAHQGSATDR